MTLNELVARFRWVSDGPRDTWRILNNATGALEGDCDDFALTALWIEAGCSWLRVFLWAFTGRAMIWRTYTAKGERHAVLRVRGKGWICNIYPAFGPLRHRARYPWWGPLFLFVFIVKYRGTTA